MRFAIALVLFALIVLAACNTPVPQPQPKSAASPAASPSSGKMTLVTDPDPPKANKPVKFRVKITDLAGNPVTAAQVKASLVMPMMDMGKNEVILAGQGNGEYEGTGRFTMVGPWNVIVTANANGTKHEQKFDLAVRE